MGVECAAAGANGSRNVQQHRAPTWPAPSTPPSPAYLWSPSGTCADQRTNNVDSVSRKVKSKSQDSSLSFCWLTFLLVARPYELVHSYNMFVMCGETTHVSSTIARRGDGFFYFGAIKKNSKIFKVYKSMCVCVCVCVCVSAGTLRCVYESPYHNCAVLPVRAYVHIQPTYQLPSKTLRLDYPDVSQHACQAHWADTDVSSLGMTTTGGGVFVAATRGSRDLPLVPPTPLSPSSSVVVMPKYLQTIVGSFVCGRR